MLAKVFTVGTKADAIIALCLRQLRQTWEKKGELFSGACKNY
jgi:hypothetical protein